MYHMHTCLLPHHPTTHTHTHPPHSIPIAVDLLFNKQHFMYFILWSFVSLLLTAVSFDSNCKGRYDLMGQ